MKGLLKKNPGLLIRMSVTSNTNEGHMIPIPMFALSIGKQAPINTITDTILILCFRKVLFSIIHILPQ
jgi:hypothetical protein